MRWTSFFSPTLRDAPADAEAISHKLLVRGGFIRQLHSGHYTLLPLAFRVRKKIIKIVEKIGLAYQNILTLKKILMSILMIFMIHFLLI